MTRMVFIELGLSGDSVADPFAPGSRIPFLLDSIVCISSMTISFDANMNWAVRIGSPHFALFSAGIVTSTGREKRTAHRSGKERRRESDGESGSVPLISNQWPKEVDLSQNV